MTYTARCIHNELWAVCRQCPEWTGWPVDPLRPLETDDEEPWTVQPEPVTREWSRWAVVLCVASMVFIALYLGRNGS